MRQRLAALCPTDLSAKSALIRQRLEALGTFADANTVALFAAQPSEPHLDPLLGGARRFCFPRVNGQALEFYAVDHASELVEGRWNLREPHPDASRLVRPEEIDLLLVPGLAFSPTGARLGRGGGFYDRLLALPALRAHRVGVCFAEQLFEELPLEAHDREVELVVSA